MHIVLLGVCRDALIHFSYKIEQIENKRMKLKSQKWQNDDESVEQ